MGKRRNRPEQPADLNTGQIIGEGLPPLKFKPREKGKPKKKQKARGPQGDRR